MQKHGDLHVDRLHRDHAPRLATSPSLDKIERTSANQRRDCDVMDVTRLGRNALDGSTIDDRLVSSHKRHPGRLTRLFGRGVADEIPHQIFSHSLAKSLIVLIKHWDGEGAWALSWASASQKRESVVAGTQCCYLLIAWRLAYSSGSLSSQHPGVPELAYTNLTTADAPYRAQAKHAGKPFAMAARRDATSLQRVPDPHACWSGGQVSAKNTRPCG